MTLNKDRIKIIKWQTVVLSDIVAITVCYSGWGENESQKEN